MKTLLTIAFVAISASTAHAAPLALEGNFHLVAGYKANECPQKISVQAVRDANTGDVHAVEIFDTLHPNPNNYPSVTFYNDGTVISGSELGGSNKSVDTITDSAADNVSYEYVLGIRFRDSHIAMKLVHRANGVDELDTLIGALCDYNRD